MDASVEGGADGGLDQTAEASTTGAEAGPDGASFDGAGGGGTAACSSGTWEATADGGPADAYGGLCSGSQPACAGDASAGAIVYADDFETNPYAGISGAWQVDNSQAQAGTRAIHPPLEGDSGTADMTISCGGAAHSELSFWYNGLNPASDQQLNFYVDDVRYATYGNTYNWSYDAITWNHVDIVVPTGPHQYRWQATTGAAGQPPYWVDSIQCIDTPVVASANGALDFEEHFVPPELGGDFRIDDSLAQAGAFAAHPPILAAGDIASAYFSCGCRSHQELTFYYNGLNPSADQHLNFYVDDALYATYGNTYNWSFDAITWAKVDVLLPPGSHHYRWDVTTSTTTGQPPYWIDTIVCQ
jgi:hypothetical protein